VTEDGFFKLIAILLLSPMWMPVLKALYTDFQGALWEEGGLFGRPPGRRDLEKLRERYGAYESPLVHEPHETRRFKDRSRGASAGSGAAGARSGRSGATPSGTKARPGPGQRRGF